MRIIAGRHRGRRLEAPGGGGVRPTSDRAREALFNILMHGRFTADGSSPLAGARVLDGFCGTGALGLEALSRGAAHATLMDADRRSLDLARANAARLGETGHVTLIRADAVRPPAAPAPQDVVFLDPPYGSGLAGPALAALGARGWLAPGALVVVEVAAGEAFDPPAGFAALDRRSYGAAGIVILRAGSA